MPIQIFIKTISQNVFPFNEIPIGIHVEQVQSHLIPLLDFRECAKNWHAHVLNNVMPMLASVDCLSMRTLSPASFHTGLVPCHWALL